MGYYSDVVLVLNEETNNKFIEYINDLNENTQIKVNSLIGCSENHINKNKEHLYYWDFIKWCLDFDEIYFIMRFIDSIDNSDSFRFIRLGEYSDDIEEKGYLESEFNVNVIRCIDFKGKETEWTD